MKESKAIHELTRNDTNLFSVVSCHLVDEFWFAQEMSQMPCLSPRLAFRIFEHGDVGQIAIAFSKV